MLRLESVNGQQAVIDRMASKAPTTGKIAIVVCGAPGTGVSWTLDQVAEEWKATRKASLQARGDSFASQRKLFPWLTLATPGAKDLARVEILKESVKDASGAIPMFGSATSHLLDDLLHFRRNSLAREAIILSKEEQDLLFVIQAVAQKKRLLLTLDHMDFWDPASWDLLALIASSHLQDLYPALADVQLLFGVRETPPPRLSTLLDECKVPTEVFQIHPIARAEMSTALRTFGFPEMKEQEVDGLYEATDGRLDLLHDFSVHLRDTNLTKDAHGFDGLFANLLSNRMHSLVRQAPELDPILSAAAILGRSFTLDDAQCLTGQTAEKLQAALTAATDARLLTLLGGMVQFQSGTLHDYFHRSGRSEHRKYHAKYAECLRIMRPGDYEGRWNHLILADRLEEALTCYALAALHARRQKSLTPEPNSLFQTAFWGLIKDFLAQMCRAYDAFETDKLGEAMDAVASIEAFLPDALLAERDYLKAQIRLKSHRVKDFAESAALLKPWDRLKDEEGEIWSRIAQARMISLVEINAMEEASRLEEDLTKYYYARRRVDPWALYALNVLRRRSEPLHRLPVATQRLENALEFFGSFHSNDLPRHPIQYYYTLNNLVANLLASARFEDAVRRAEELDALVNRHALPWPSLEIPINNFVLAGFLSGKLSAEMAVRILSQVQIEPPTSGDSLLIANNYAVLLAHAGQVEDAKRRLQDCYRLLSSDSPCDPYHKYFIGNNVAALTALTGDSASAKQIYEGCLPLIDGLYPTIRETIRERHGLLGAAIGDAQKLGIEALDRILLGSSQAKLGKHWEFYGRGFLLSDIQFWSVD
ncbi:MAG TPA: hypothetical protein VH413_13370 [Verrucomicrobiae bacterium]|jgi:hypothetical protein|nr:hypothetical protein [Verrucomicrobiae bacterium]